jgi:sigma-B regulation protein RsbU (phosphoserine phosphatase)
MPDNQPLDVRAFVDVLNHLNLGVYITDVGRKIRLWNRKAEEITGHQAADVVGKACHDNVLVHVDKDGHRLCTTDLCPLHRAMKLGKESEEPLLVFAQKADGTRVAVSVTVAPLRDEAGNIIGGVETFSDEGVAYRDLQLAKKIQRHLLPQALPEHPNISFDVRYYPHDLVGGDFYDIRELGPGLYGMLVADVSGHGVSAALYTMWLKSLEESAGDRAKEPGNFIAAINRELSRFALDESFATAFYAVIDAERCEVAYANAGHPPPLCFRSTGGTEKLKATGVPLGVLDDATYDVETIRLNPGDLLVCYSDGITEVNVSESGQLGTEGLAGMVAEELARSDQRLLERVYRRVKRACGDVSLADDVLLLSIRNERSAG